MIATEKWRTVATCGLNDFIPLGYVFGEKWQVCVGQVRVLFRRSNGFTEGNEANNEEDDEWQKPDYLPISSAPVATACLWKKQRDI